LATPVGRIAATAESGSSERCQKVTASARDLSFRSPACTPTLRPRSIVRTLEKPMNSIPARPGDVCRRSKTRKAGSRPTRPSLRIGRALPRILAGATAALAAVSAALCVFGPLSDQRALQLSAGPHAKALAPQPIDSAFTGRPWGTQDQTHADAKSVAPSSLAVGPSLDATSRVPIAK